MRYHSFAICYEHYERPDFPRAEASTPRGVPSPPRVGRLSLGHPSWRALATPSGETFASPPHVVWLPRGTPAVFIHGTRVLAAHCQMTKLENANE